MVISHSLILRMRNVLDKSMQKISEHTFCSITCENHAVYEIMWKNMIEPDRPQMEI
jgi:hypothetical protein